MGWVLSLSKNERRCSRLMLMLINNEQRVVECPRRRMKWRLSRASWQRIRRRRKRRILWHRRNFSSSLKIPKQQDLDNLVQQWAKVSRVFHASGAQRLCRNWKATTLNQVRLPNPNKTQKVRNLPLSQSRPDRTPQGAESSPPETLRSKPKLTSAFRITKSVQVLLPVVHSSQIHSKIAQ